MEQQNQQQKGMSLLAWMFWWGLTLLALFGIYHGLGYPFGHLSTNKTLCVIFFYIVLVFVAWMTLSANSDMKNQKGLWESDKDDEKKE